MRTRASSSPNGRLMLNVRAKPYPSGGQGRWRDHGLREDPSVDPATTAPSLATIRCGVDDPGRTEPLQQHRQPQRAHEPTVRRACRTMASQWPVCADGQASGFPAAYSTLTALGAGRSALYERRVPGHRVSGDVSTCADAGWPSACRTAGATSVPNSSIARIDLRRAAACRPELDQEALVAEDLVLEEDLLDRPAPGCRRSSAPRGVARGVELPARVIGGQPRSRPIRSIIAANGGKNSSAACSAVVGDEAVRVDARPAERGRGRPRRAASR